MRNKHTSSYLSGILQENHWTEAQLAERADLTRSVVSAHMSGRRVIRRTHLGHYLRAVQPNHRFHLLVAWLSDDGLDQSLIDRLKWRY